MRRFRPKLPLSVEFGDPLSPPMSFMVPSTLYEEVSSMFRVVPATLYEEVSSITVLVPATLEEEVSSITETVLRGSVDSLDFIRPCRDLPEIFIGSVFGS